MDDAPKPRRVVRVDFVFASECDRTCGISLLRGKMDNSQIVQRAAGKLGLDTGSIISFISEDDVLRVVRRKDGRMTTEVPAGADRFLQTTGPLVAFVGKSGVVGLSK